MKMSPERPGEKFLNQKISSFCIPKIFLAQKMSQNGQFAKLGPPSAKASPREILKNQPFVKLNPHEINHSQKFVQAKLFFQ